MQVYEVLVWKDEKKDKDGEVVNEAEIVLLPELYLASSESVAVMKATKQIPDRHVETDPELLRIVVRPFG